MFKHHKENQILIEQQQNIVIDKKFICRVVLDDFRKKKVPTSSVDEQPSTSPVVQQASTSCQQPTLEPDVVEIVDVDSFEQNGLKARRRPNPFYTQFLALKKEVEGLRARVHDLEGNMAPNAQPEVAVSNDVNITAGENDSLNISDLGSFVLDTSFKNLEDALSSSEIARLLIF